MIRLLYLHREHGYKIVFGAKAGNIVYADTTINLTQFVLEYSNGDAGNK